LRPEANISAVPPLTRMPTAATAITVVPATPSGWNRRRTASAATAPVMSNSTTALNSAASMEVERRP
jgi:hypothetical protein